MSERWCKLYPHALTDPLWLAVADDAGTSPGLVGATFVELLTWTTEHAPDTGSIAGFDPRVWAAWLRIAPEAVERIIASLRKFGRLAGDTIANWAKRQGQVAVAAAQAIGAEVKRKVGASTIRVRAMRARRKAAGDDPRSSIFRRDGNRCRYCGTARGPFQIDHVIPLSRGGSNEADNLATACATCNHSKAAMTLAEWEASGLMPHKTPPPHDETLHEGQAADNSQFAFRFHVTETAVSPLPPQSPPIDSDLDLESPGLPPFPHDVGAKQRRFAGHKNRRAEGTNPRALGINPRRVQGEILMPIRGRPPPWERRAEERRRAIAEGFANYARKRGLAV
jgi:ribosomal protein S14